MPVRDAPVRMVVCAFSLKVGTDATVLRTLKVSTVRHKVIISGVIIGEKVGHTIRHL